MNAQAAYEYLIRQKGLPPDVAAGIVDNLFSESSFAPDVIAGTRRGDKSTGSPAAYVQQLRGQRRVNFEKYAKASGRQPGDVTAQLDFILEEMDPKSPYRDAIAVKHRNEILNAGNRAGAAEAFGRYYERPDPSKIAERTKSPAGRLAMLPPADNGIRATATSSPMRPTMLPPADGSPAAAPKIVVKQDASGQRRVTVEYQTHGQRTGKVTSGLEANIGSAVEAIYGPGSRAVIYSGGQARKGTRGQPHVGTIRHDDFGQGGRAADVYAYGPDGKQITGNGLAPLAQYWRAKNNGGVGLEMKGGGIHLDEWTTPPKGGGMNWNYADKGGRYTPQMAAAVDAGNRGILPGGRAPASAPAPTVVAAATPVPAPAPAPRPPPVPTPTPRPGILPPTNEPVVQTAGPFVGHPPNPAVSAPDPIGAAGTLVAGLTPNPAVTSKPTPFMTASGSATAGGLVPNPSQVAQMTPRTPAAPTTPGPLGGLGGMGQMASGLGGILSAIASAISAGTQASAQMNAQAQDQWKEAHAQTLGPGPAALAMQMQTDVPGREMAAVADPSAVPSSVPGDINAPGTAQTPEEILVSLLSGTLQGDDPRRRRFPGTSLYG